MFTSYNLDYNKVLENRNNEHRASYIKVNHMT